MKSRLGVVLASASVFAAVAWLLSRVVVGLDFTDEMQYYGEIASLTRTGKFFQDDLFIQQLGYLFLLPFFKLHAAVFPDQEFLVLFGRLLLVGAYTLVGFVFWRSASKLGGFSTAAKLTGLAAFVAWIPFQILAPGYNSLSYLLLVCIVSIWMTRAHGSFQNYALCISPLLAALTVVYPPAGVAAIVFVTLESGWRGGPRRGLQLFATTILCGTVVGGIMIGLHGTTFIRDLLAAVEFSRAFRVGYAITQPDQLAGGLALILASGLFIWRMRRGTAFPYPLGPRCDVALRWGTLAVLAILSLRLLLWSGRWAMGYSSAAGFIVILMLLAISVTPPDDGTIELSPDRFSTRGIMIAMLVVGGAVLLAMSMRWATGYFATSVYMVLLMTLCALNVRYDDKSLAELVAVATVLAAVFGFTSGNGVHNFGLGVAVAIPFLLLYCSRQLGELEFVPLQGFISFGAPPAIVALLLFNAASYPYREQQGWDGFERVPGVPAFAGIWTSFVKADAVKLFRQLAPHGELTGQRLLVAGPHPWAYFAFRAQPATSMFFMHFTGGDRVHEVVAERLFLGGEPDAILITNSVPPQIHARINQWMGKGCTVQKISLPPWFIQRYHDLLRYDLGNEVMLLRRDPVKP